SPSGRHLVRSVARTLLLPAMEVDAGPAKSQWCDQPCRTRRHDLRLSWHPRRTSLSEDELSKGIRSGSWESGPIAPPNNPSALTAKALLVYYERLPLLSFCGSISRTN